MRAARAGILLSLVVLATGATGTTEAKDGEPARSESATTPMLEHADPIASYTLHAKLDPSAHTLHGSGTIAWKNASKQPVKELWLHLYLNAFKNQSSVFMRAPIGGFRGSTVPSDWGAIDVKKLTLVDGAARADLLGQLETKRGGDDDETDARLPLPDAVEPGASITLEIEWDDKLPTIVERTGYFGSFHMLGQWFPKIAKLEADGTFAHFPFHHLGEFYADFGTYDVTLDVPAGFVIGATGPAIEEKDEGGRHVERHVQGDVHDFAWTAWDEWQVRKERIADVDVTVLTPPHYDDHAARELETVRFALPHYGARYGKYPYPVLTVVHPPAGAPEAGGMEYPTLITTGWPSWLPRGIHQVEAVTIHELGHQWFYGLVATNEDAWPFLDEGVNSYAENDGMRAFKGAGSGIDFLGIQAGDVEAQSERARHFGHDERVAQGAGAFMTGASYGALIYSRTAAILETIARAYGREKMEAALGTYARAHRFRHPTPDDLLRAIGEHVSPRAEENLRVALFEKGWVDYAITQISSHPSRSAAGMFDRDGKRETLTLEKAKRKNLYDGWVLVVRRGTLKFPVDVTLIADDGTTTVVPWDGQSEAIRVPYSGARPLRAAVVDRWENILLDGNRENDFATAPSQPRAGAPKTLARATWWAATLLGGLGP
ncbi:MAG: M1 family metallopeptidase [Labilithrix sp.]|nr:M1 family metallopeptidase [Labilithrix sp.]MCW5817506.1 M1 family metallopeptidase [Labilithrix sp.]